MTALAKKLWEKVVSQWMNQDPLSSILRLLSERRLCKLSGTTDQNGFFEANLFHRDYEMEISHPAMKNYTCSFNSRSLLITMFPAMAVTQVQLDRAKVSTKSAVLMNLESRLYHFGVHEHVENAYQTTRACARVAD
ncbi:hypothetical protein JHK86_024936 [Glycine max]|nr:hypothetical protein JHK86_024936 [Glycine max]